MTLADISRATGVNHGTLLANLRRGDLCGYKNGSRWVISPGECLSWSAWAWSEGKYLMHPPHWVRGYLETFGFLERNG